MHVARAITYLNLTIDFVHILFLFPLRSRSNSKTMFEIHKVKQTKHAGKKKKDFRNELVERTVRSVKLLGSLLDDVLSDLRYDGT